MELLFILAFTFFCEYQLKLQPDWQQRTCLPWWVGKWVSVREYHSEQLQEEFKNDVCIFENFCVGEKLRREHEWEINWIHRGLKDAEILARIFWKQNAVVVEALIILNKVNVWSLLRVGAVHFVEQNRFSVDGHHSDPCTLTSFNFLCSPTPWTKCSILLMEMPFKSPGVVHCWPRCLNVTVAKAAQSWRTCEAVVDACCHLSHLLPSMIPNLNSCFFKWLSC